MMFVNTIHDLIIVSTHLMAYRTPFGVMSLPIAEHPLFDRKRRVILPIFRLPEVECIRQFHAGLLDTFLSNYYYARQHPIQESLERTYMDL
jgi:hypothetical protein